VGPRGPCVSVVVVRDELCDRTSEAARASRTFAVLILIATMVEVVERPRGRRVVQLEARPIGPETPIPLSSAKEAIVMREVGRR
jgi:hypothetical protein